MVTKQLVKTLIFFLLFVYHHLNAQTLQNGIYNNSTVNVPTKVEHTGKTVAITMSDGIKYFTLKNGNTYTRTYTNPYNSSMVRYYEVIVLSSTKFSIGEIGKEKQIWVYLSSGGNENTQQTSNCNCEQSADAKKYFDKAMQDMQAHTCSYCAELARWQCLYQCDNTNYSRTEIEQKIAYYEKVLQSYQSQTVTNATSQGGLKTEQNSICCPELIGKGLTYGDKANSILATSNDVTQNATGKTIKFENVVNEQFGTLLESLMTDGKIDETNAKAYLETVFGYDESVSNYLKTVSLTQQISNLQQGSMSFDDFLSSVNQTLLHSIPSQFYSSLEENMEGYMMVENVLSELQNGQVGSHTVNLVSEIIKSNQEWNIEKQKNAEIANKLSLITPQLSKLQSTAVECKKLEIIDDVTSKINWIELPNPPIPEITMNVDVPQRKTFCGSQLENGHITITDRYNLINTPQYLLVEDFNYYKNPEKFDFSKDFSMNLYFKIGANGTNNKFTINIGNGYQLIITHNANGKGWLFIETPDEYLITEKYGKLKAHNTNDKTKKKLEWIDKERYIAKGYNSFRGSHLVFRESKLTIDFDAILKINILKKDDIFTVQFNDLPGELTTKINYFPNKHYLGFKVENSTNTSFVELHKLELKHL